MPSTVRLTLATCSRWLNSRQFTLGSRSSHKNANIKKLPLLYAMFCPVSAPKFTGLKCSVFTN